MLINAWGVDSTGRATVVWCLGHFDLHVMPSGWTYITWRDEFVKTIEPGRA